MAGRGERGGEEEGEKEFGRNLATGGRKQGSN